MTHEKDRSLRLLRRQLAEHLSSGELKMLAEVFDVDWNGLPGQKETVKTLAFISLLDEQSRLGDLIRLLHRERPGVDWPELPAAESAAEAEDPFQDYINEMSDLLRGQNLWASVPGDNVRDTFQRQTLAILPSLDGERKGKLLQFLLDTELLGKTGVVSPEGANLDRVRLRGADLSKTNLSGANLNRAELSRASLHRANLSSAKLGGANLWGADLSQASLREAQLWGANLNKADLRQANLAGASLSEADLWGADLRQANLEGALLWRANLDAVNLLGAWGLSNEQLAQAKSMVGAILPDGNTR